MTTSEVTNQSRPSSAGDAAHSMAETARGEGKAVVDSAKQETARLASTARSEMRKQGDEQTRRLAERVREVAQELEGVRRGEAPTGTVATVLSEVETRAERMASRLDEGGIQGVASEVKQFARQRPGMFLFGAFGLGIVAGRTLRNADTRALADAAKPGAASQHAGSEQGGQDRGQGGTERFAGQSTLDPSAAGSGATPEVPVR